MLRSESGGKFDWIKWREIRRLVRLGKYFQWWSDGAPNRVFPRTCFGYDKLFELGSDKGEIGLYQHILINSYNIFILKIAFIRYIIYHIFLIIMRLLSLKLRKFGRLNDQLVGVIWSTNQIWLLSRHQLALKTSGASQQRRRTRSKEIFVALKNNILKFK